MFGLQPWWYFAQTIIFLPQTVGILIGLILCWRFRNRNATAVRRIATGLVFLQSEIYVGSQLDGALVVNVATLSNYLRTSMPSELTPCMFHWPSSSLRATGILLMLWGACSSIGAKSMSVS